VNSKSSVFLLFSGNFLEKPVLEVWRVAWPMSVPVKKLFLGVGGGGASQSNIGCFLSLINCISKQQNISPGKNTPGIYSPASCARRPIACMSNSFIGK
jgi:hypothetical protein